ncbi:putative secreted protein [Wickerhamomyces ciferrii]|uniref:Secreted protein n=1 Tax=Wickerhamomyces ciferrii (strain ATCC 14091 / BCRC 22168 / CBS 111 / JCM 3599 / NBRC 0793 / NRRL Y-1031 F-60-10) TaxID=1206466 RepID=K0KIZ0_WICCF|nr:uncharacterized protein BN7_1661 [Wickerhamomyces ciferrii]CCH42117.1 putative secreted protein [Wickerhamomyces ciferrii]
MALFFNKYLLLCLLSYVVYLTLDWSSPELIPVKANVNNLWNQVQVNPIYTDYVSPVQNQFTPYYQEYIVPSYNKVQFQVNNQYHNYVSHHVDTLTSKIIDSSIYNQFNDVKPKVDEYWDLVESKVKFFNNQAIKFSIQTINQSYNYLYQNYQTAYPLAVDFYHNKAIPFTKDSHSKSLQAWNLLKIHSNKSYIIGKTYWNQLYSDQIKPFYNKIIPVITPIYDQYFQKYVELIKVHVLKYYTLFKLEQIGEFLQNFSSSTYEKFIKITDSKQFNINKNSTVATTETGTSLESTESLENPEITPIVEDNEEDILEAPESEIPQDTEVEPLKTSTIEIIEQVTIVQDEQEPIETNFKQVQTKNQQDGELTLSLADEITAWNEFISNTVENIFRSFNKTIDNLQNEKIEEISPILKEKLSNLSNTAQFNYIEINKIIWDINSTSAILENNQQVELNQDDNLIDHKISRQEIRDFFTENSKALKKIADNVNTELQKSVAEVEEEIELERKIVIDILEEFAEVAINEFSKKMMFSTYSNNFKKIQSNPDLINNDDESFNDWKQYIKSKNYLISKRNELTTFQPKLTIFEKKIGEIGFHLKTLEQETGSAFAIARAKANLAFQARESRERSMDEILEQGGELTKTIFKINTATLGDDGIITPGSEEVSNTSSEIESKETVEPPKVDVPVRNYANVEEITEEIPENEEIIEPQDDEIKQDIVEHDEDEEENVKEDEDTEEEGEDDEETEEEEEEEEDTEEDDTEEEDEIVEHKPDTP